MRIGIDRRVVSRAGAIIEILRTAVSGGGERPREGVEEWKKKKAVEKL